ncbi:MAG: hypothetical protein R3Y24_07195 [Eubacteriales bacterium]
MIKSLKSTYQTYRKIIENWLFPITLLLYPLIHMNQGIDLSDTTYSLGNYLYLDRVDGMWAIATYLSNIVGSILVKLPFGEMLLMINLYTSLILSVIVLSVYYGLRKEIPAPILWIGEIIAIGMCWIPTVILYNYLTYLLFVVGLLVLYKGIIKNADESKKLQFAKEILSSQKQNIVENTQWNGNFKGFIDNCFHSSKILFITAGFCLGVNVMVRVSNLTQMALIIGLWYGCWYQKEKIGKIIEKTVYCLVGYIVGVGITFSGVLIQYGFNGLLDMINGLSSVQGTDESYTIFSMIMSVVDAYVRTGKWIIFSFAGITLGMAMFAVMRNKLVLLKKIAYCGGILILLRFFWGRGMFSFRYYEAYSSIYEWGMVVLYLGIFASIIVLLKRQFLYQEKVMAVLSLIVIIITPLGSNNYTYQNINNLFIVLPFTIYVYYKLMANSTVGIMGFSWQSMIIAFGIMILVQSVGFHFGFVFKDGIDGQARNATFSSPQVVWGMSTTYTNAEGIGTLMTYWEEQELEGMETIFWGDIPGLSYLLQMPFAISSSWPDLDSFSLEQMSSEMEALGSLPVIIMKEKEFTSAVGIEKNQYLMNYIESNDYEVVFQQNGYTIYQ